MHYAEDKTYNYTGLTSDNHIGICIRHATLCTVERLHI